MVKVDYPPKLDLFGGVGNGFMNKTIYNPYTVEQRSQYVQTRKAALALRPDITGAQFDETVYLRALVDAGVLE